jgi:hypothetical protein
MKSRRRIHPLFFLRLFGLVQSWKARLFLMDGARWAEYRKKRKKQRGIALRASLAATRPIVTTCLHINNYYKRVTFLMCF